MRREGITNTCLPIMGPEACLAEFRADDGPYGLLDPPKTSDSNVSERDHVCVLLYSFQCLHGY